MVEVLFVHGALVRDGDWWWRRVAELVARRTGVRSRAVALPTVGEAGSRRAGATLADDARALADALVLSDGAVVVGHSYGGTVMAEGADHLAAEHLVYISSYLPDVGQSQAALLAGETDPVRVDADEDGLLSVDGYDLASFSARFVDDVEDPALRSGAWARVTAQSAGAFVTPTTRAAWVGRPSTYLVCTDDRSTSLDLQRTQAARAGRSVDLPTGHHPFLSRPDLVADELETVLGSLRG